MYKRLYRDVEPGRALIERTVRRADAHRRRARGRVVLIPAVAALLALLGFAYAATQSGLLKWVFGPIEPMPEVQQLVEAVGERVDGQFVSASVEEVFFDGGAGFVQWNLTTNSDEPLVVFRSRMWSEDCFIEDGYRRQRSGVYEESGAVGSMFNGGFSDLGQYMFSAAFLGEGYPAHFPGISALGVYESVFERELMTLDRPIEVFLSFCVLRPAVPIYADEIYESDEPLNPVAILSYDTPATMGRFVYDVERTTVTRTSEDPPGWGWGKVLQPGETETYDTVAYKEIFLEASRRAEEDTLLTPLGLIEERDAMFRNPNGTEVLRWCGKLLETMGYGEIVEEVTVSFTLRPRSELPVNTVIDGQSAFEFDAFRAEISSADFDATGGDIRVKLWPDYEKADPRIVWKHTAFDVYLYRDGVQIGDRPANFQLALRGNRPEPWFEIPEDYVPPDVYEGSLLVDAVSEYPDTIVIVPKLYDETWDGSRTFPGDYSMTIHLKES